MAGFDAASLSMVTLQENGMGPLADITDAKRLYRWCGNATHGTCNWLIPAEDPSAFCIACQLNRTIPELSEGENLARWKKIEMAKHRLVYSLLRLKLPIVAKKQQETPAAGARPEKGRLPEKIKKPAPPGAPGPADGGIAFDFMANISPDKRVMTGHNNGVITLNIEEADEAERARNKQDLGEKYRTLLGHFRHEIGHYYWDALIRDSSLLAGCRVVFGDERKDYQEALKVYYSTSPPADWADHFISPYASSHPWEDWAETWSHYMHMMDTLETAYAFGIGVHPGNKKDLTTNISRDPYNLTNFDTIFGMWLPLTFAVNSLNRSMGYADFYPFVISPAVTEKLRFIHRAAGAGRRPDKLVL